MSIIRTRYGREHGELFIDHGASPGIPKWMAEMAGYDPELCKEGKRMVVRTLCCKHCKVHVVPNPKRTIERASCPKCDHHFICDICAFEMTLPDYSHTPFEKKVDLVLAGQPLGSPLKLLTP